MFVRCRSDSKIHMYSTIHIWICISAYYSYTSSIFIHIVYLFNGSCWISITLFRFTILFYIFYIPIPELRFSIGFGCTFWNYISQFLTILALWLWFFVDCFLFVVSMCFAFFFLVRLHWFGFKFCRFIFVAECVKDLRFLYTKRRRSYVAWLVWLVWFIIFYFFILCVVLSASWSVGEICKHSLDDFCFVEKWFPCRDLIRLNSLHTRIVFVWTMHQTQCAIVFFYSK